MSDLRKYLDLINEASDEGPEQGDYVEVELGDTLLETYIEEVLDDGVIIKVDETALKMMIDARKHLSEQKKTGASANGSRFMITGPASQMKDEAKYQSVAEGTGNFAKAINNLHGWYQVNSNNPDIEIFEFDDGEGGFYAEGSAYHNIKTGRVKIKFDDKRGEYGGINVNDIFNSIGDAMNALRQITTQIRPNTSKAKNFDRLGDRSLAGPDDVYKTDKTGKKGTLTKSRINTMKTSIPNRITGPKGVLPEQGVAEGEMDEAKYQGREVPLNKPMQGDVAKSKVYVRGPKGNVVKVNFGDKNMRIKKSNPNRRKSFRARHRCENPGPKWKARYWSCRAW